MSHFETRLFWGVLKHCTLLYNNVHFVLGYLIIGMIEMILDDEKNHQKNFDFLILKFTLISFCGLRILTSSAGIR